MQLSAVDLNLLVTLDALLEERHVGRAAQRVGLSQSAMSHALARLRELFDDPLFVRSARRMQPTARATALQSELKNCLDQLGRIVFEAPRFDPKTSSRSFRIASEDYFSAVMLPPLIADLRRSAPGIDIELVRSTDDPLRQLKHEDIDVVVGVFEPRTGLRREVLYRDENACLVRRDHPNIRRRPSLERYANTPHVVVSVGRRGPTIVDRQLAKRGLQRRITLRVDNFLAAPLAVAASDLMFTCPARLAVTYARTHDLRRVTLPLDLGSFEYVMVWSPARDDDPAHAWLRSRLRRIAKRV